MPGLDAVAEEAGHDLGDGHRLGAVPVGPRLGQEAERLDLGQGPLVERRLVQEIVAAVTGLSPAGPQLVGPDRGGLGRCRGGRLGAVVGRHEPHGVVVLGRGGRCRVGQREAGLVDDHRGRRHPGRSRRRPGGRDAPGARGVPDGTVLLRPVAVLQPAPDDLER